MVAPTYFDHVSSGTSFDLIEYPVISVTEQSLTDEQITEFREWMNTRSESGEVLPAPALPESWRGHCLAA